MKALARIAYGALGMSAMAALAGAFAAIPSAAQAAESQAGQAVLEEVLVTARRRQVAIEEAPVAVSALSGEDFDRANIVKLDNFNGYVPGLVVAKNDGAGRVVTIRGIGWETAQNLTTQPSVLSYIDGIYLANPIAMGLDLGDIERVEVFRGPQGTEFGQGTTGGSINVVTKKPRIGETLGEVDLGYGTYGTFRGRASVNVPLGETAAFRASLQRYRRDGFAEVEGGELDGYDLDDAESTVGKIALLWEPADNFSVLAQAFLHDSDQHAAAQKNVQDPNSDSRELSQDYPGMFALENYSASLIMEWQLASGITIKSLTGWQKLRKEQTVDGDRLTEELTSISHIGYSFANWDILPFWDNDSDAVSQEISISQTTEQFNWVVGGYYLDHENFNDFLEATGAAPFSASTASLPREQLTIETLPPFASDLNFTEFRTVTRKDYAVYGQGTFKLNERFAVTAGLRYQDEDQLDVGGAFFGTRPDRTTKDSQLTWKAGVDIHLTGDSLVYGLISTGWKNGGSNSGGIILPMQFEPEEVTAYEIGTRNTLAGDRLRLNVTAFYYDHDHLQFTFEDPAPFAGGTWTIPKLEEYGIEGEFSWLLSDGWQLDGMLAWQDGKVKSDVLALDVQDFRNALVPFVLGLFTPGSVDTRIMMANANNLRGNKPPKLVELMARLALSNTQALDNGSTLASRLEWVHRGEFQARVFNHPEVDTVPSYNVVNLHFEYDFADAPLSLSLSVTNLFDNDGVNNVFTNPYGLWTTSRELIPPREVIASVKYWFD
jgi:iron complex outermembrane receptor protein